MESNDPQQGQSNPQGYTGQRGLLQQSPHIPSTSTPDRFRPSAIQQSPTLAPSSHSGQGQQYGGYGYGGAHQYGSTMPTSAMQYGQSYPQDSSRLQQSQQAQQQPQQPQTYGGYAPNLMYGASAQQQAHSPASPYGAMANYGQSRQPPGMQVLPSQFGVTQQYYMQTADAGSSSAAAISSQNLPSQYAPILYSQQSQTGRPRSLLGSPYGTELPKLSPAQAPSQQHGEQAYATHSDLDTDGAYSQYRVELRRTHESARAGRLQEAGNSLMALTVWLLGNADALNLTRDDEAVYDDRLRLWEEFNNCWLVTLQKQVDMTSESIQAGQRTQPPQSIMSSDAMTKMGDELVRLCDNMERHGLVDYQLGVWEEPIMDLLSKCLEKLEGYNRAFGAMIPGPTSTRRR